MPYLTARLKLLPNVRRSPPWRAVPDAHPLPRDNPMTQLEQSVAMVHTGLDAWCFARAHKALTGSDAGRAFFICSGQLSRTVSLERVPLMP